MRSYREYVVRCKTCNTPLAHLAQTYEDLLASGLTIEQALNNLGLDMPHCRAAMMNPTYVNFNMENRDVVEGVRTAESVEEDFLQRDPSTEGTGNPIFVSCLPPNVNNLPTLQPTTSPRTLGIQTVTTLPIRSPTRSVGTAQVQPTQVIAPIIAMDLSALNQPLGAGIPVQQLEVDTEFKEPTIPGVPTINHNPKLAPVYVDVGAGKKCVVLNGRTYLAQ